MAANLHISCADSFCGSGLLAFWMQHPIMYGIPVRNGRTMMDSITVNQFRDSLRKHVEKVLADHEPLKVTRRNGGAFIVIGAEDWEREQETLFVLQNRSLLDQIRRSAATHAAGTGYAPTEDELGEIHHL